MNIHVPHQWWGDACMQHTVAGQNSEIVVAKIIAFLQVVLAVLYRSNLLHAAVVAQTVTDQSLARNQLCCHRLPFLCRSCSCFELF